MKKIFGYLILAALLASCEGEAINQKGQNEDIPINMVVSVDTKTRADDACLSDGDKIGLYAFRHKNNQEEAFMGVRHMENLPLVIYGGKAQADMPIYFPKYDDKTDFYMYYPYGEDVIESSSTVATSIFYKDQSSDENYSLSDKMLGVTLNVEKSPSPVHFQMKRLMSRISFRLKPGKGFGDFNEILSAEVLLKNVKNSGGIDFVKGLIANPFAPDDIVPHGSFKRNYTANVAEGVDALIIPQKAYKGSVLFVVSVGDRKFNGVMDKEIEFQPGKQYTFTMTVNRVINGDEIAIAPEITEWNEGIVADGGVVEVDPGNDANYVTDIDGNEYRILTLGAQRWMGENLKVTRFNDGTPIKNIVDQTEWDSTEQGEVAGYCYYDNDPENGKKYGALYNWYSVMPGKLCPEGWHVPTVNDFKNLILYLGEKPGTKIKAKEGWQDVDYVTKPEYQGTDEFGFNALPGGNRKYQEGFMRIGMYGEWWTSEVQESYTTTAYLFYVYARYTDIRTLYHLKETGHAVRCIKD